MRIVINADDFGYDSDTVRATIECLEQGAVRGASLMANMPASGAAIDYARAHKEHSWGLHLTFVTDDAERPLCRPSEIPDLLTPTGSFLPSNGARLRALLGRLPQEQIEREMTAQLALVRDHGITISHVDSHGHLHKFAPFRRALSSVLPRFSIWRVRNVQDIYLGRPLTSPTYWLGPLWRLALCARFQTTTHFYMPTSARDADWGPRLLREVSDKGGSLEVGVHPGYSEAWRDGERRAIQAFAVEARQAGHEVIGWRDL